MSQKYNTNLAAEYYVLSMLYRKGLDAHLTLSNKKSIDIIIEKEDGRLITVDVKGLAGKICWPMDNFTKEHKSHFIVLVSFLMYRVKFLKYLPSSLGCSEYDWLMFQVTDVQFLLIK